LNVATFQWNIHLSTIVIIYFVVKLLPCTGAVRLLLSPRCGKFKMTQLLSSLLS